MADITEQLDFPLVVKPRRASRSRGLSLVSSVKKLRKAIRRALEWDTEALVEEFARGKEFTCTVYGNDVPATLPLNRKIMDFERREIEASGGTVRQSRFPVLSDEPFVSQIHEQSKMIYSTLQCRDMIRIDWKWDEPTQALRLLEINSLPWMGRTEGNIEECAIAVGSSYEIFLVELFRASLRRHHRPAGSADPA
jgi:D-alanine-D-alanine ligase